MVPVATDVPPLPSPAPAGVRSRARRGMLDRRLEGWQQSTRAERAVATATLALTVAWIPGQHIGPWPLETAVGLVLGLAGLPLLLLRAVGGDTWLPGSPRRAGARLLVAWLVVGLASTMAAAQPLLALVGRWSISEGWLFMAVLAGCWAVGTVLRPAGRSLLASVLVVGALANAVVAAGQLTGGLGHIGLAAYGDGQPVGFLTNPVYLGGLEAGAVLLLGWRLWRAPARRTRWVALATCAVAVGIAGERMSMLVVLAAAAGSVAVAWWRPAMVSGPVAPSPGALPSSEAAAPVPTGAALPARGARRRVVAAAGLSVAAMVVGTGLAWWSVRAVAHKLGGPSAQGTFGDRLHAWLAGLQALVHHPLLGAGPGQFQAATQRYFPLWYARSSASSGVFADGHDLFVEYAVTTGVLGLLCLVGWALTSLRHRNGPLAAFAVAVLAVALIEPLSPAMTPLLFLAAGAASPVGRRAGGADPPLATGGADLPLATAGRRRLTAAVALLAVVGLVLGTDLVVGTRLLGMAAGQRSLANEPAAQRDARWADRLLAPWPVAADQVALAELVSQQAGPAAPTPLALAASWQQRAAARDLADTADWVAAAQLQMELGQLGRARADARTVLRIDPYNAGALRILGDLALAGGDRSAAVGWFRRLVAVQPHPGLAALLSPACSTASTAVVGIRPPGSCR